MFGVTGLHFNQLQLSGQRNNWLPRVRYLIWAFHWTAGHILGGMIVGGVSGWVGSKISAGPGFYGLILLALICVVCALHQFQIINFPLPQLRRQVSRFWMQKLHWNIVALGYGVQLGSGIATRIKVATTYVFIGCAFLSGTFYMGAVIGAGFGLARAILPVIIGPRVSSPEASFSFALNFNHYEKHVRNINGALLLLSALFLITLFWLPQSG